MSTSQPSADPSKSRLRGDMYLRAEQRRREELEAAQAEAPQKSVATDKTVATEYVAVADTFDPPAPLIPEPARPEAQPSAVAVPVRPPAAVRSSSPPAARRAPRRQQTLRPAAVLAAIAMIASLGVALTLSPGESPEESPAVTRNVASSAPEHRLAASETVAPAQLIPAAPATASPAPPAASRPAPTPSRPAPSPPPVAAAAPARSAAAPAAPKAVARQQPAVVRTSRPAAAGASQAIDGQIRITSIPAGARVTVDGIGWGQTPVTVRNVPFGRRTVRLTHDGYTSQQAIVQVSSDTPTRAVEVALRRK